MTGRSCVPRCGTLAVVLALVPGLSGAGMSDPTRPLAGQPGGEPAAAGAASARPVAPATAPAVPPAEPQLQSLQLPRDGVASALVDGQLLRAGQRWNAFEIVAIDAQGVLAKGPGGPQRWTLVGVQYLDPKARARWPAPAPAPAAPVAATGASAVSLAPAGRAAAALQTAQWQYTPVTPPAPALPPVTRLSWADLVAPAPRAQTAPPPRPTAPTRTEPLLRLPSAQAARMQVAAGPSRPPQRQALVEPAQDRSSQWRGLRFEWPTPARPQPSKLASGRRTPLRGPLPPSVVLTRPGAAPGAMPRWTTGPADAEAALTWWTPPVALRHTPVTVATTPVPVARRSPPRSPRSQASRSWAHAQPRPVPAAAPTHALRGPVAPTAWRSAGPHALGVVALNKETP